MGEFIENKRHWKYYLSKFGWSFFIIHIEIGHNYGIIDPWLGGITYAANYSN